MQDIPQDHKTLIYKFLDPKSLHLLGLTSVGFRNDFTRTIMLCRKLLDDPDRNVNLILKYSETKIFKSVYRDHLFAVSPPKLFSIKLFLEYNPLLQEQILQKILSEVSDETETINYMIRSNYVQNFLASLFIESPSLRTCILRMIRKYEDCFPDQYNFCNEFISDHVKDKLRDICDPKIFDTILEIGLFFVYNNEELSCYWLLNSVLFDFFGGETDYDIDKFEYILYKNFSGRTYADQGGFRMRFQVLFQLFSACEYFIHDEFLEEIEHRKARKELTLAIQPS